LHLKLSQLQFPGAGMIAQKIAERSRKKQKDKFETERNHHEILHLVKPDIF